MEEGGMASRSLTDVGGWEAFLHGVFAIAITLLVLDIHVPPVESTATGADLVNALRDGAPHYFAYLLGFGYIGAYWLATHRTLRMMRGVDHAFLVLGLIFLMMISAVPFFTSLLAEYIGADHGRDQVAILAFLVWMLLLSIMANISVQSALYHGRLLKPGLNRRGLRNWTLLTASGPVVWTVAIIATLYVSSAIALALMAIILVMFLQEVPGVGPEVPMDTPGEDDAAALVEAPHGGPTGGG
jgi:uncharacterized membrane protein